MITCPKCNSQNQIGAKFCAKCGQNLTSSNTPLPVSTIQQPKGSDNIIAFSILIAFGLLIMFGFLAVRLWRYFYLISWAPEPYLGSNAGQGSITFVAIGLPLFYLFYLFSSFLVKKFRQNRRTAIIVLIVVGVIYVVAHGAVVLLTPKDIAQILYHNRSYELLIKDYPEFVSKPDIYPQIKSVYMEWTKDSRGAYGISFDIEHLEQLLQINPQDKEIRDRIGELYERSGLSRLENIKERNKMPGPGLKSESANKQDLELAIDDFKKALEYNPNLKLAEENLQWLLNSRL